MAFHRIIQGALGAPIRGGHELVIRLNELVEGLMVDLHEKTDHDGMALGDLEGAGAAHSPAPRAGRGLLADCC
jgi:hypothetical protein